MKIVNKINRPIEFCLLVSVFLIVLSLAGCQAKGKTTLRPDVDYTFKSIDDPVCLLGNTLPPGIVYKEIARIQAGKGTYGGTDEVEKALANEARRIGLDVLIKVRVGQRFKGPFPWRVVSPVGDSIAIEVAPESPPFDCIGSGGKIL